MQATATHLSVEIQVLIPYGSRPGEGRQVNAAQDHQGQNSLTLNPVESKINNINIGIKSRDGCLWHSHSVVSFRGLCKTTCRTFIDKHAQHDLVPSGSHHSRLMEKFSAFRVRFNHHSITISRSLLSRTLEREYRLACPLYSAECTPEHELIGSALSSAGSTIRTSPFHLIFNTSACHICRFAVRAGLRDCHSAYHPSECVVHTSCKPPVPFFTFLPQS